MEWIILGTILAITSITTCLCAIDFGRNKTAIVSFLATFVGILIPDYLAPIISWDVCLILTTAVVTLEIIFLLRVGATILYKYLIKKQKATHTLKNHN